MSTEIMTQSADYEKLADAMSGALGLSLAPAHRPGVVLNLQRLAEQAELVTAFDLVAAEEPAPVFRP